MIDIPVDVAMAIDELDKQLKHREDSKYTFDTMMKITERQYKLLREYIYEPKTDSGGRQNNGIVGERQSKRNIKNL